MTDRKVLRAVFATDPARVINMAALETAVDPTPGIQGRQRLLFELRQGKYSTCRMRRVCVVGGSLLFQFLSFLCLLPLSSRVSIAMPIAVPSLLQVPCRHALPCTLVRVTCTRGVASRITHQNKTSAPGPGVFVACTRRHPQPFLIVRSALLPARALRVG